MRNKKEVWAKIWSGLAAFCAKKNLTADKTVAEFWNC